MSDNPAYHHHDVMVDLFTTVSRDCAHLGLQPVALSVSRYSSGLATVSVQMPGEDLAAVDLLASIYELPEGDAYPDSINYTRVGHAHLTDMDVEVRIYTGKPKTAEVAA